jgi:hypothetical protein
VSKTGDIRFWMRGRAKANGADGGVAEAGKGEMDDVKHCKKTSKWKW